MCECWYMISVFYIMYIFVSLKHNGWFSYNALPLKLTKPTQEPSRNTFPRAFKKDMVPNLFKSTFGWQWYCWWLKSCTTRDVWNPVNNGINYQPQLVSRISAINSISAWMFFRILNGRAKEGLNRSQVLLPGFQLGGCIFSGFSMENEGWNRVHRKHQPLPWIKSSLKIAR